jgi:hypothetical protein
MVITDVSISKRITIHLNEAQLETYRRMIETLPWSDEANIVIRKDGHDHHFDADWLRCAVYENYC